MERAIGGGADRQLAIEERRTPAEERESEHAKAIERWSAVWVLAERVDAVHDYFQHAEPGAAGQLRTRREPLTEAKREAQRVLRDAEVARVGPRLAGTMDPADDRRHARCPAGAGPVGPAADVLGADARPRARRPWFRQPEVEEQPVPWLDREPERPDVEPVDNKDESGQVSELVEHEGATS